MTKQITITRLADECKDTFKSIINGEVVEGATIKLQGFTGELRAEGFKNVAIASEFNKAYYCEYESEVVGVKLKDLTHKSDDDMSNFTDGDIDTFNAKFNGNDVEVKRINGKACVFAKYSLLVYNPKL